MNASDVPFHITSNCDSFVKCSEGDMCSNTNMVSVQVNCIVVKYTS